MLDTPRIEALEKAALANTAYYQDSKAIAARFTRLKAPKQAEDKSDQTFWQAAETQSRKQYPTPAAYALALAKTLSDMACEGGENAPYIARGILQNRRGDRNTPAAEALRAHVLHGRKTPAACPGVQGLNAADWLQLEKQDKSIFSED